MGGSTSTQVYQPPAPPQPTTGDAVNAWVKAMPQVYEMQMKYAPLEAQQQVDMLKQYGTEAAQAYKAANDALYPETAALQEQLATQASEGMQSGVPDWMKEQYRNELRAQVGDNALAGSGADYISRGMLQQAQDYQNYYRNLGLSVAGRQPLAQASSPQTTNMMGQNTLQGTQNFMSQNYGTFAAASRPFANFTQDQGGLNLGLLGRWGGSSYA